MLKEAFGTGSTLDEAKTSAFKALCAPDGANIKYEVVERPKSKVFGLFGGSPAKIRAYYEYKEDLPSKAKEYINFILKYLGVEDAEISAEENDEEIKISITCSGDYGSVIGRRGETLDSIQYLTRLVANKGLDDYKRVAINIGDYREKRENVLRNLARRNAAKVRKYGGNAVLEPMNPYERRIIHTAVQEIEGVSSHSVGSESERRVVISLAEGFKPTSGGSGRNYNRSGGFKGGSGGYGRSGGYKGGRPYGRRGSKPAEPRNPSSPASPPRAPRSDSASASLYGKIEVNNKEPR